MFQKHLGQAESRTNTLRLLITILKPKGIDYQVELRKEITTMFLITQFTMEHMNHRIALQLNCQLMEILFTSLGYNRHMIDSIPVKS